MWKKFIAWMKCEDENGNSIEEKLPFAGGIRCTDSAKYSELIKRFPIHGKIGKEDIIQMSHKLESGEYETCYVTIKQLKDAIGEMS